MDTLAVFRSRSEALKLYNALNKLRIGCYTVSTPTHLKLGCGLSVVFSGYLTDRVKAIIAGGGYGTFVGFFPR